MAGLWKADYGPGGIQIVLINYDFTGPAARIAAVKVCSSPAHPWKAHCKSLSTKRAHRCDLLLSSVGLLEKYASSWRQGSQLFIASRTSFA